MTNNKIEKQEHDLARPLKELAPLIKQDLRDAKEAADEAAMPYYIAAGEKLIEAKSQLTAMRWGDWLTRNFHLSQTTAYNYITAAKKFSARRNITFRTASEAYGDTKRHPGHRPAWTEPVQDVLKNLRTASINLRQRDISLAKEREVERALGLKLIDIGYKVLSVKLHPDKGGSHDAMQRLNRVRARLKEAA